MNPSKAELLAEQIRTEFLAPPFTLSMIELVVIRRGILSAINSALPSLHGTVLDVGCGFQPYKSLFLSPPSHATRYIGMDLPNNVFLGEETDLIWDGGHIPLPDESVECAVATEFFEHCGSPERVMGELLRVLKPGGLLFLTVPFLWYLHEVPHDEYRYTPFSLRRKLTEAGFCEIELKALGGISAALAIMIGMWIPGRISRKSLRTALSYCALPVIRFLWHVDTKPNVFSNGTMITGLSGMARKPVSVGSLGAILVDPLHEGS